MPRIVINGNEMEAEEGMSVLQAVRSAGIRIPTLCYHEALKPIGACKLCGVEVRGKTGKSRILLACILKVKEGLDVATESDLVTSVRQTAFRNLLTMAPQSRFIRHLAEEFRVEVGPVADGCVRCRLCIRVCKEIVGAGALKMETRDGMSFVTPEEGRCIGCGTCANICPTEAIQITDRDGTRIITIRDEIIGVHVLERCHACGRYFASQKFLKHVEMKTTQHTAAKDHPRYCPTCTKLFSTRIQSSSRLKRMG